MSAPTWLFVVFSVAVAICASVYYVDSKTDCDHRGGVLVRGDWGYACVEGKP